MSHPAIVFQLFDSYFKHRWLRPEHVAMFSESCKPKHSGTK